MPSRMIHYLVAEQVAEQVKIKDINRFKIGSLCPDMSHIRTVLKIRLTILKFTGIKKVVTGCGL